MRTTTQDDAYSDKQGMLDLQRHSPLNCARVTTSDPRFIIDVERRRESDFTVFLLHDETPVGVVFLHSTSDGIHTLSSYLKEEYRGKGYAKSIYRWLLEAGFSFVTEGRQSEFSHRLWKSLGSEYPLLVVQFWEGEILFHGPEALENMCTPSCENVLLGRGRTVESFADAMVLTIV